MRKLVTSLVVLFLVALAATANAQIYTTSSPGVDYAMDTATGFNVNSYGEYGTNAMAMSQGGYFNLIAWNPGYPTTTYADAGIVLDFNSGLTLGELQSVTVTSTGSPVSINLWLDTSGNGSFFAFDGAGNMTGAAGDSYGGTGGSVDANSSFYMLGGDGAGNTYTLAQLIAGDDAGINANTLAAIWIGVTNPDNAYENSVGISSVDVQASPEPSSLMLLGTGFLSLVGMMRRKLK